MTHGRLVGVVALLTLGLAAGCSQSTAPIAMIPASMGGLTAEIDTRLATDTDWVVAGSSRLVAQLADGAAADLLVTADRETMQSAVDQGLIEVEPLVIAGNRLVLAVAPGNPGDVDELADLTDPALLLGICAVEVPCGRLALEAATALDLVVAADTEEPNVRALAVKVANGELDAGLVYATDAIALDLQQVDGLGLAGFVTEYLAAPLSDDGHDIVGFFATADGRALLTGAGFTLP